MNLKKLDENILNSEWYQFFKRNHKLMVIVEGILIIILLSLIISYFFYDYNIKSQIRDKCGYTTSKWECICEKNFVENWKEIQKGNYSLFENNTEVTKTNE